MKFAFFNFFFATSFWISVINIFTSSRPDMACLIAFLSITARIFMGWYWSWYLLHEKEIQYAEKVLEKKAEQVKKEGTTVQ